MEKFKIIEIVFYTTHFPGSLGLWVAGSLELARSFLKKKGHKNKALNHWKREMKISLKMKKLNKKNTLQKETLFLLLFSCSVVNWVPSVYSFECILEGSWKPILS